MQPLQNLLSRIRWDREFGTADFRLGYYDRIEDRIIEVSLRDLGFDPATPFMFEIIDEEGVVHSVPFHRVRQVWRNGLLIWQRQGPGQSG